MSETEGGAPSASTTSASAPAAPVAQPSGAESVPVVSGSPTTQAAPPSSESLVKTKEPKTWTVQDLEIDARGNAKVVADHAILAKLDEKGSLIDIDLSTLTNEQRKKIEEMGTFAEFGGEDMWRDFAKWAAPKKVKGLGGEIQSINDEAWAKFLKERDGKKDLKEYFLKFLESSAGQEALKANTGLNQAKEKIHEVTEEVRAGKKNVATAMNELAEGAAAEINTGKPPDAEKVTAEQILPQNAKNILRQAMNGRGITEPETQDKYLTEFFEYAKEKFEITTEDSLQTVFEAFIKGRTDKKDALDTIDKALKESEKAEDGNLSEDERKVLAEKQSNLQKVKNKLIGMSVGTAAYIAEGMTLDDFIQYLVVGAEGGGAGAYNDLLESGMKAVNDKDIDEVFGHEPKTLFMAIEEALILLPADGEVREKITNKNDFEEFQTADKDGKKEFDQKKYWKWLLSKWKSAFLTSRKRMTEIFKKQLVDGEKGRMALKHLKVKKGGSEEEVEVNEKEYQELEISQEAMDKFVKKAMGAVREE